MVSFRHQFGSPSFGMLLANSEKKSSIPKDGDLFSAIAYVYNTSVQLETFGGAMREKSKGYILFFLIDVVKVLHKRWIRL